MILPLRARALACGLTVVLLCLLPAGVADAAPSGKYAGHTSQGRPISFHLGPNDITNLQFQINATCPSRHIWRVTALGFPPIKVVDSRFDDVFGSHMPSATATVKGRVFARKVIGALTMKRYIGQEHAYCRGTATFSLLRQARAGRGPVGSAGAGWSHRRGRREAATWFAWLRRRYYDAGSERMA